MQMSVFSLNVEVNLRARLSCDTATLVLVQAELRLLLRYLFEMCAYPLAGKWKKPTEDTFRNSVMV